MNKSLRYFFPLLAGIVLNYLAQIPYYFHQYYVGRHLAPSWPGTFLLLFTFVWFLAGYTRFVTGKKYGVGLLLSFLAAQVLFYGHAIVFGLINGGGIVAQMNTHSPFLFVIFLIGYINFGVAAYYLVRLLKDKSSTNIIQ